jgi:hypothetical protein
MKQIRIQRRPRRSGGSDEPTSLLPVTPASDTRAAHDLLSRIDRALEGR